MNLYLRLFLMLLTTKFQGSASILDNSITYHRVLPNDLDPYGHMNNGRYFAIADLARIRKLLRAGLWQEMKKRKVLAFVADETIQFRKPLMPFQKYAVKTRLMGWDAKYFYVEQTFFRDGDIHALLLVRGRPVRADRGSITPRELFGWVEKTEIPEERMNDVIRTWNESTKMHWERAVTSDS